MVISTGISDTLMLCPGRRQCQCRARARQPFTRSSLNLPPHAAAAGPPSLGPAVPGSLPVSLKLPGTVVRRRGRAAAGRR